MSQRPSWCVLYSVGGVLRKGHTGNQTIVNTIENELSSCGWEVVPDTDLGPDAFEIRAHAWREVDEGYIEDTSKGLLDTINAILEGRKNEVIDPELLAAEQNLAEAQEKPAMAEESGEAQAKLARAEESVARAKWNAQRARIKKEILVTITDGPLTEAFKNANTSWRGLYS